MEVLHDLRDRPRRRSRIASAVTGLVVGTDHGLIEQGIADRLQLGTVIPLSRVKDGGRRARDRLPIALPRDRSMREELD